MDSPYTCHLSSRRSHKNVITPDYLRDLKIFRNVLLQAARHYNLVIFKIKDPVFCAVTIGLVPFSPGSIFISLPQSHRYISVTFVNNEATDQWL